MKLVYLPVNQAYIILWHDQIVTLEGMPTFIPSRLEAIAQAIQSGLGIQSDDSLQVADARINCPSCGMPTWIDARTWHLSESVGCTHCHLSLSMTEARESLRNPADAPLVPYGSISVGEIVRWHDWSLGDLRGTVIDVVADALVILTRGQETVTLSETDYDEQFRGIDANPLFA